MKAGAKRRMSIAAVAATLSMLAAGCGGSSNPSAPTPERAEIQLGLPASADAVPAYIGVDHGIFEKYGLNVTPVAVDPASVMTALVDGDIDIALVDYAALFKDQAAKEEKDLRVIAEGYQAAPGVLSVVVMQDSAIDTPAELAGKRIAVDQAGGLGQAVVAETLDTLNVSSSQIEFVAMPFEQMADALRGGGVDAAWMVEPHIARAEQGVEGDGGMVGGVHRLLDTATGVTAGLPISGYAVRATIASELPRTIAAFQAAISEAKELAGADRTVVEEALVAHVTMDEQTATLARLGSYPTSTVPRRLQRVADLLGDDVLGADFVAEVLTRY